MYILPMLILCLFPSILCAAEEAIEIGFPYALLLAFLGGIVLNLMPCVLPVISLKALSFVNSVNGQSKSIRRNGIFYALGIHASFTVLVGMLLILQYVGYAVGWGFQMQSPIFVTILAYIMFAVALNLSGFFEFPALSFSGVSATEDGIKASFFTGVLVTLVSTPCSAPFMATAVGFALAQPPVMSLLVLEFLAFGLAFPYLLMSYFPAVFSKFIPKPGNWMIVMKEALAFPLYLTVIWLLWLLSQQTGSNNYSMLVLCGLVFIVFSVWLWKLSAGIMEHKSKIAYMLMCLFILWIPMSSTVDHSRYKVEPIAYSSELVAEHLKLNDPVFVAVSADWCFTCKVNDKFALKSEEFYHFLRDNQIVYIKADWTNHDDAITEYLVSLDRRTVPTYVMYYQGKHHIFSEILTPGGLVNAMALILDK